MKKLLTVLISTGLVVSTGAILVSCESKETIQEENIEITLIENEVDFKEAVDITSIKIDSVELDGKEVLGITLKDGFTFSGESNMILVGLLVVSKKIGVGEYVIKFSATPLSLSENTNEVKKPISVYYTLLVTTS